MPTLTVAEFNAREWRGRLGYRLFRNPLVMFGLGPLFGMILGPRIEDGGLVAGVHGAGGEGGQSVSPSPMDSRYHW